MTDKPTIEVINREVQKKDYISGIDLILKLRNRLEKKRPRKSKPIRG